jgi:hypothetical protein
MFVESSTIHMGNYKTNEDILSALKINPAVKKIQNYRNEWRETDCHTSL